MMVNRNGIPLILPRMRRRNNIVEKCKNKQFFYSLEEAEKEAEIARSAFVNRPKYSLEVSSLRGYKCNYCYGYHYGHNRFITVEL